MTLGRETGDSSRLRVGQKFVELYLFLASLCCIFVTHFSGKKTAECDEKLQNVTKKCRMRLKLQNATKTSECDEKMQNVTKNCRMRRKLQNVTKNCRIWRKTSIIKLSDTMQCYQPRLSVNLRDRSTVLNRCTAWDHVGCLHYTVTNAMIGSEEACVPTYLLHGAQSSLRS